MVFPIINMIAAGIVIYFAFTAGALVTGFEQKPKEKVTTSPAPATTPAPAEESTPEGDSTSESASEDSSASEE